MTKWIPCGDHFIVGDIVRWREAIWKPKKSKKAKNLIIGDREVQAQVLKIGAGIADLQVMHCVSKCAADSWADLPQLVEGAHISRSVASMARWSKVERAQWGGRDGEGARNSLASRFIKYAVKHD